MSHSRLTGLAFSGLGLALIFFIIPWQTEVVDYGLMRPQSLPTYMGWAIVFLGLVLTARSANDPKPDFKNIGKAFLYWAVLVLSVILVGQFGFVVVAPFLAMILMAMIGERRLNWFIIGVFGTPFFIWLTVEIVLERQLP